MPDSTVTVKRIADAWEHAYRVPPTKGRKVEFSSLDAESIDWHIRFAEALLASERSARAEAEKVAHEYATGLQNLILDLRAQVASRDKVIADGVESVEALERELTALRSQVASAKVEGAREALTKLSDIYPTVTDMGVLSFRNAEYPVPATPPERVSGREDGMDGLRQAFSEAINRASAESGSDTPDFILAEFLTATLIAFDRAITQRRALAGGAE